MKRLTLICLAALALSACSPVRGQMMFPSSDAVAAVKLLGITEIQLYRPGFSCDPDGDQPTMARVGDSTYLQSGAFYAGKQNGQPVHGAVCWGKAKQARISVLQGPMSE